MGAHERDDSIEELLDGQTQVMPKYTAPRRRRWLPWAIVGAVVLAAGGIGVGITAGVSDQEVRVAPAKTTPASSAPAPSAVAQNLEVTPATPFLITRTDANNVVNSATWTISRATLTNEDTYQHKFPKIVTFHVNMTATTGDVEYSSNHWYVRDASGKHYLVYLGSAELLDTGTAHEGEKVVGDLTFDAPPHGTLVYEPVMTGSLAEMAF